MKDYSDYPGRIEAGVFYGEDPPVLALWKVLLCGEDISERVRWVEPLAGLIESYILGDNGGPQVEIKTPQNPQWHLPEKGELRIPGSAGGFEEGWDARPKMQLERHPPKDLHVYRLLLPEWAAASRTEKLEMVQHEDAHA